MRWRLELERAHGLAHLAARDIAAQLEPSLHLTPAAQQLASACEAMYGAWAGTLDRATAINQAHARLLAGAILVAQEGMTATAAQLVRACHALLASERALTETELPPRLTPRPHCAGHTEPVLHAPQRGLVSPRFTAPSLPDELETVPEVVPLEIETPKTFEALEEARRSLEAFAEERAAAALEAKHDPPPVDGAPDAPPEGFARVPDGAADAKSFSERWLRECIDEIGMLGLQRRPLRGDAWRDVLPLEIRIVRAIDAAIAFGADAALVVAEGLALDAPVADPMRMFAVTMLGGCIEGRDALAPAERVLMAYGADDPAITHAFVDAMKVVPHSDAPHLLRGWLDGAWRDVAVEIMAHRGWLTPAELTRALHDGVALHHVVPAMASHPDLPQAIELGRVSDDAAVRRATLRAMTLAARRDTAEMARGWAELDDDALIWMGLTADQTHARWLCAQLQRSPTPGAAAGAGWAGSLEAVVPLIGLLSDEASAPAAAEALDRLLGAGLTQTIAVEPDALVEPYLFDPDPDPKADRPPLDDGREPPPEGSPEELEVPSTDPAVWRAYWQAHQSQYDPAVRYRRGQPYSTSVVLHALDQRPLSHEDRHRLHAELCFRTGRTAPFSPDDFVTAQHRGLQAWSNVLARDPGTPGAW